MKAITVRQPWAHCIAAGRKNIENRSWSTHHRGLIAIHAGIDWDTDGAAHGQVLHVFWPALTNAQRERPWGQQLDPAEHPDIAFGAVVAMAEITGVHYAIPAAGSPTGVCCPPWGARDQWHWVLRNVEKLPRPVPARGRLRLWDLPVDWEQALRPAG